MRAARRAPASRRQRTLVLAGMAGMTIAGVVLAFVGLSTVRNSTAGDYQQTTAPDDPGYQASVVPTPTLAVLHRGPGGGLAGAWLLALEPDDDGGSIVLVPPATLVTGAAGGPETTIADVYRRQGAAAAADALGRAVTVGVSEFTEVDDERWARLVEPVGSLEITLDDAVGQFPAGPLELAPEDVGPFLSAQAEDESDLDRLDRQQMFWNAWLPRVADGGPDTLPGEVETGLGRFVLGVATGEGTAAPLPVRREDGTASATFRADATQLGDFVAQTVPYPTSAEPGGRVRVRLLNGTGDGELTTLAARKLVARGAEITIAGNADTLDEPETVFAYTGADRQPLALWMAGGFGGADVEEVAGDGETPVASDEEIDVTVILGHDAEDLIER